MPNLDQCKNELNKSSESLSKEIEFSQELVKNVFFSFIKYYQGHRFGLFDQFDQILALIVLITSLLHIKAKKQA